MNKDRVGNAAKKIEGAAKDAPAKATDADKAAKAEKAKDNYKNEVGGVQNALHEALKG